MVNFVETLFGVTIVLVGAALVLRVRGSKPRARRTGLIALGTGTLAAILELYLQIFA